MIVPGTYRTHVDDAQALAASVIRIVVAHLQSDPDFYPTLLVQIALGDARDEIAVLIHEQLSARDNARQALDRIIQTVRGAHRARR
jgi:hypothetical protein